MDRRSLTSESGGGLAELIGERGQLCNLAFSRLQLFGHEIVEPRLHRLTPFTVPDADEIVYFIEGAAELLGTTDEARRARSSSLYSRYPAAVRFEASTSPMPSY